MNPVQLRQVVEAQNALSDAIAAVARTNERGPLDALEASAVEFIVRAIDRLLGIEPLGPAIAHLFSPITRILDDLAGDPSQIYAQCDQLERQASALREMPASIYQGVDRSRSAWYDTPPADSFRTLGREYGEIYPLVAQALDAQSGVVNQVAVTVVKTKVAIMNLVIGLVWDLIELALKLVIMPWKLFTVVADVTGMVLSVLYQARDFANGLAAEGNGLLGQQAGLARALTRAGDLLLAKGGSDREFDERGPGFSQDMRSTEPHPDDDLMSDVLAGADGKGPMPPGWTQLSDQELADLGIDLNERNGDGFGGQILRGPDGQLVVKFDGTDFSYAPDVIEDGVGGVTMSAQSARAMEVAEQLRRAGLADDAVYVGNSLGGRLAAVAALSQGGVAVTFNAAGVSPGTMEYLAAQRGMTVEELYHEAENGAVRAYHLDGEILTDLQQKYPVVRDIMPDAPGRQYTVPNNGQTSGMNPVEKHTANGQIGQAMRDNWPQLDN